ncbi:MAG: hypothetical protein JNK21_00930 [Rhodospirillaceae bacterium]|nr:hypothetical protein [Rhodospirillaceae bacterium]
MNAVTPDLPEFKTTFGPFRIVENNFAREWEFAGPMLVESLRDNKGTLTEDDLLLKVLNRKAVLVVGQQSALIFENAGFDRVLSVIFGHCGGNLDEVVQAHEILCMHFRAKGIEMAFIAGRDGWARALPGYEKFHTTYVKVL